MALQKITEILACKAHDYFGTKAEAIKKQFFATPSLTYTVGILVQCRETLIA